MSTHPTLALLGLGAMGSRMAARLVKAGYPVVVWNRTKERAAALLEAGATWAETPRAAAEQADLVLSMVADDAASQHVWLDEKTGAVAALTAGKIALECSTLTPDWSRRLAEAIAAQGAAFLDTPVIGTRPHAEAGQLVFLVGGEAAALENVRAVLDHLGAKVLHLGAAGKGMTMKLAVNAFFGIQVAAVGEMLAFLTKAGMDRAAAADLFGTLPITSPIAQRIIALMKAEQFSPNFPVHLVRKDLGYAVEAGKAVGAELPTTAAVQAVFEQAEVAGFGEDDLSGVVQLFGWE